ncbi:MAG: hypothetical protein HY654_09640 [Acidobacteria bacterium]|nr:hypothetical protein [Acidobacteriota bacterium]
MLQNWRHPATEANPILPKTFAFAAELHPARESQYGKTAFDNMEVVPGKSNDGAVSLEQAMALLLQNQAKFVAVELETSQRLGRMDERFARIERDLDQIKAILNALPHTIEQMVNDAVEQMMSKLPEAVRQKIGFRPK